MRKHAVLLLCLAFWWLALTSTAIAATPVPATPAPAPATNVAPEYTGPVSLGATDGTELKIAETKPISIHDTNNDLKEVKLVVEEGTLSVAGTGKATISGPTNKKEMTLSGSELDINEALKTLTYKNNPNIHAGRDTITVNASDKANNKMVEQTILIAIKQNSAASEVCDTTIKTRGTSGGQEEIFGNWSAGPTISYSLIQYNLADKKSSFNATAAGAGISFRRYSAFQLAKFGAKNVSDVPSGCLAKTYEFGATDKAHSWISVSPTMYAFQDKNADNFGVQFALNFGFFDDIFTVGAGWNLSGDNAGEWFILAGPSIGFGF